MTQLSLVFGKMAVNEQILVRLAIWNLIMHYSSSIRCYIGEDTQVSDAGTNCYSCVTINSYSVFNSIEFPSTERICSKMACQTAFHFRDKFSQAYVLKIIDNLCCEDRDYCNGPFQNNSHKLSASKVAILIFASFAINAFWCRIIT